MRQLKVNEEQTKFKNLERATKMYLSFGVVALIALGQMEGGKSQIR